MPGIRFSLLLCLLIRFLFGLGICFLLEQLLSLFGLLSLLSLLSFLGFFPSGLFLQCFFFLLFILFKTRLMRILLLALQFFSLDFLRINLGHLRCRFSRWFGQLLDHRGLRLGEQRLAGFNHRFFHDFGWCGHWFGDCTPLNHSRLNDFRFLKGLWLFNFRLPIQHQKYQQRMQTQRCQNRTVATQHLSNTHSSGGRVIKPTLGMPACLMDAMTLTTRP